MNEDNQEIIDKLEVIIEGKCEKIEEKLKSIDRNLEFFALGALVVGALVGDGVALSKAIWIMLGCGFLWFIYTLYRENKHTKKAR